MFEVDLRMWRFVVFFLLIIMRNFCFQKKILQGCPIFRNCSSSLSCPYSQILTYYNTVYISLHELQIILIVNNSEFIILNP